MAFIVIMILIFIIVGAMSDSGGGSIISSNMAASSAANNTIYRLGQFESGVYNEESNVYTKGPIFSYPLSEESYFYAYGEGKIMIKNSSGIIEIQLMKVQNRRIIPYSVWINGEKMPVVNQHGEFVYYAVEKISIARTLVVFLDLWVDGSMLQDPITWIAYTFIIGTPSIGWGIVRLLEKWIYRPNK